MEALTRRQAVAALATASVLTAAGAAPAVASVNADRELFEALAVLDRIWSTFGTHDDATDAELDAVIDAWYAARDRVLETPALTPAGIAAKLNIAIRLEDQDDGTIHDHRNIIEAAIRDAERLAGRAAA